MASKLNDNLDLDLLHETIEYDIDTVVKQMVDKVMAETRNKISQ
jgi:hypothetical protein